MADLFPTFDKDILPPIQNSAQVHSPEATEYLSQIAAASAATFQNHNFPTSSSSMKAMVETVDGEKNVRKGIAAQEVNEKLAINDQLVMDKILEGATREEIKMFLEPEAQVDMDELARSALERRASKFLIDSGMGNEQRAAAILKEEFDSDIESSSTDKRQDFISTMMRINTIRERFAEKYKEQGWTDTAMDFAAMMLAPGYTSLTSAKVFGRGVESLGNSVTEFSKEFWTKPMNERMEILSQFEKDLENNSLFGGNVVIALTQIEELLTVKDEDELIYNITEGLDASMVGSSLIKLFRGLKSISSAAKVAGNKDLAISRALEIRDKEFRQGTASPFEQDEMVESILPSSGTPKDSMIDLEYASPNQSRSSGSDKILGDNLPRDIDNPDLNSNRSTGRDQIVGSGKNISPPFRQSNVVEKKDFEEYPPSNVKRSEGEDQLVGTDNVFDDLDYSSPNNKRSGGEDQLVNRNNSDNWTTPEKPSGLLNKAIEEEDIVKAYSDILPNLISQIKKAGISVDESNVNPIDLLQTLRGTVLPNILNETEQAAANISAIKEILKQFDLPMETRALIDPEKFTGGMASPKNYPAYDVTINELNNVRTVNVYLGTGSNKLKGFTSAEAAMAGAERMGLTKGFYSVSDRTGEFFIKVSKDVTFNPFIRVIDDKEIPLTIPIISKYLWGSAVVSPEDAVRGARLSVSASSRLASAASKAVENISKLGMNARESYNNLMLDIQQKEKWMTVPQVKEWYKTNYKREPSQAEVTAYLSHRTLHEFDFVIRNSSVHRELVGAGYQELRVKGLKKSPFVGKEVTTTGIEPGLARIFDADEGKFKVFKTREELTKRLNKSDDTVLIKQLSPSKAHGEYIITRRGEVNIRPLRSQVLNKVDGPHRMYEGDHFIKQQNITPIRGQEVLQNPRTHFAIKGAKEAKKFADEYNLALEAYLKARQSGTTTDKLRASDVISRFTRFSGYDEFDAAVQEGKILTTPFEVVKDGALPTFRADELRGYSGIDPDYTNFSDDLKSLIEQGRMFYSERGARLPHPREGMATLLHPDEILSKAVGNVINTQAYGNFKVRQINRWVNTYGKYLIGDPNRPMIEKFMYGQFDDSGRSERPIKASVRTAAEAQRNALLRTLGQEGPMERAYGRYRDQIIDMIDNKVNSKAADKFANITSNSAIGSARGIAFKAFLGMLDVSQLIVQTSLTPGIMGVFPKSGLKAASSYPMFRAALMNPKHVSHFAKLNEKLTLGTMKAKEFEDMFFDAVRSGIDIVDGNLSSLDNLNNSMNVRGMMSHHTGKITDALSIFFTEAEKAQRLLAFNTSWMESYARLGRRLETPEEFAEVGVRAQTLTANMMKDGKSFWQEGVVSVPMQFQQFPFRVAEVLIAPVKGFTPTQRLRYYMGLALAYGTTLGFGGSAMNEYIRQQYLDATGELPDERVMNGITRGLIGAMLPETDISRLQPFSSSTLLSELFDEDKADVLGLMLGPVGAVGNRFYDATLGSAKLWAMIHGEIATPDVPFTLLDVAHDIMKTAASYNRYDKAVIAHQMKKYITNKGDILQEDIDEFDAAMIGLGFPPIESKEAFEAAVDLNQWQKTATKDARVVANFIKAAMGADENSSDERRNFAYAKFIIDRYKEDDPNGMMNSYLAQQIDKHLKESRAYNIQVFERLNRVLGSHSKNVLRGNE